ncbi:hypothetical protein C9F11_37940 [Streptomyces sp. YIM 121038]|nr:hypothetical protein [Streptomyces sp. YIM 121038]QCX81171.1 hypothetical protein C9F11_37940 [Streptomyces sp. YIM 121038]
MDHFVQDVLFPDTDLQQAGWAMPAPRGEEADDGPQPAEDAA